MQRQRRRPRPSSALLGPQGRLLGRASLLLLLELPSVTAQRPRWKWLVVPLGPLEAKFSYRSSYKYLIVILLCLGIIYYTTLRKGRPVNAEGEWVVTSAPEGTWTTAGVESPSKLSSEEESPSKLSSEEESPSKLLSEEESPSKLSSEEESPSKLLSEEESPSKLLSEEEFPLKLLPEEEYKSLFQFDGIWLGPKNSCECAKTKEMLVYQLEDYIAKDQFASVTERREEEFEEHQRRYPTMTNDAVIAAPNTPLSYPIYGADVMPLHTIVIPGLGFHGKSTEKVQVILRASFGTLNTLAKTSRYMVHGRGEKELTISTSNVKLLNHILKHVTYTSTVYLVNAVDMVSFETGSHLVTFPVAIRQLPLPKLFDPGPENNIRDLVTITTKTFLRYHKLRILLKSIRQFYPDIKVIVADDSEHPEKIEEANVEHYIMPFGKGWFAGRNLAVSQVTTKYYLWVDDDCLFTRNTKIETLVEVLENTNLDLVTSLSELLPLPCVIQEHALRQPHNPLQLYHSGGECSVQRTTPTIIELFIQEHGQVGGRLARNDFKFKIFYEEGEDGSCLHIRSGSYHPLEDFPNCVITGGVANFFLARTEESRRVAFDPKLQRVAHIEFFVDALGNLLVGSCNNVDVDHQSWNTASDSQAAAVEKTYNRFRLNTQEQVRLKLSLHYFKNRLKCYTRIG